MCLSGIWVRALRDGCGFGGDVKYKYEESQDVLESEVSDQMKRWWGDSVNIQYLDFLRS